MNSNEIKDRIKHIKKLQHTIQITADEECQKLENQIMKLKQLL